MESGIERVLLLHDYKFNKLYVTRYGAYVGDKEMIGKLRDPHCRVYHFREVFYEDLETYQEEMAWFAVNTTHIPWPFDPERNKFMEYFDLLWERGKEMY